MADRNLTQGPVSKLVVTLSLPVLATFGLQSLYALVNLFFVGWLGGPAVAGLSISLNTFFLVLAMGQSVGSGGLALLAQAYGRGERAQVPVVFQQLVWLTLALGVALWVAGHVGAGAFMRLFTADPEVIRATVPFFQVYSVTFLFQLILMVFSYCYRAVGDFTTPAYVFSAGLLLNLALDPLLMFGLGPFPRLGLLGAGYASALAQGAGVLAYAWQILGSRRGHLLVLRRPFRLDGAVLWRIVRIGAPSGVQFLLFSVILMITYRYVGPFGAAATAAVGICFRVAQSAMMPCVAVGAAVAALVGQNYGARQFGRVKAAIVWGLIYAGGLSVLEGGVLALAPRLWVGLFASDPEILSIGVIYLLMNSLVLTPYSVGTVTTFAAQGMGRTLAPMLAVFIRVGYYVVALQVIERVWGITLMGVLWASLTAVFADFLAMSVVLAVLWVRVLKAPPVPAAQPAPEAAG